MGKDFKRVAIIGIGLIGGSLGLALKSLPNPPEVIGIVRREEVLIEALSLGAIDSGTFFINEGVKDADLVFVATPVGIIVDVIKHIIPHLKKGAIITDVGSTKASIVKEVGKFLPPHLHFIGGHPMTGSEKAGVTSANPNFFKNAYYILTPDDRTDTGAFRRLHALLTSIGSNVIALGDEKHDRIMATISHLPHLVAASLVNLASKETAQAENLLFLTAGGFRDTTRIAAGSSQIWADISMENKEAILEMIQSFQKELGDYAAFLKEGDKKSLEEKLRLAREVRLNLPSATKRDLSEMREALVSVVDRPGIISDITLTVGNLGINIEDIEILHTTEISGVLRLVICGAENTNRAAEALRECGYEVEVRGITIREQGAGQNGV